MNRLIKLANLSYLVLLRQSILMGTSIALALTTTIFSPSKGYALPTSDKGWYMYGAGSFAGGTLCLLITRNEISLKQANIIIRELLSDPDFDSEMRREFNAGLDEIRNSSMSICSGLVNPD